MCTVTSVFQIIKPGFYAQVIKGDRILILTTAQEGGVLNFSTLKNVGRGTVVSIAT